MRFWRKVFPNFQEYFIDRFEPDIFIHTWSNEGWWTPHDTGIDPASDVLDVDGLKQTYRPISCAVENMADLMPFFNERAKSFRHAQGRPAGVISMFYKTKMGVDLLEQYVAATGTHYDLVIRMRPDVLLHQPMPEFDPNFLYTVEDRNHMRTGIGDMFQIGSLENVSKFARIVLELENIYRATNGLCPHITCEHWVRAINVPWREVRFYKSLQRRDGLNTQTF